MLGAARPVNGVTKPQSRPGPTVTVRPLRPTDLPRAATRQRSELSDGFFSQLGPRFLERYLQTYLDGPAAMALAVEVDGDAVGHLVGTVGPGHFRWALRAQWRALLPAGVLALLLRPAVAWRFARTRAGRYARAAVAAARHRPPRPGGPRPPAGPGPAALLHVAVDPAARGAGAGAALVEAFEARAREAGCRTAQLVTFGDDDGPGALAFYRRLGWELSSTRTDDAGRQVLTCSKQLL